MTLAVALVAAAASAQSTASTQSTAPLGDVARQNAEKRATSKKATKVFTNADLTRDPRQPAPETATEQAAPPAAGGAGQSTGNTVTAEEAAAPGKEAVASKEASPSGTRDEKYWRDRASGLRKNLDDTRAAITAAESKPPGARSKQYERDKKMLAIYQQRWEEMLQSAKQANVPDAWLEPK